MPIAASSPPIPKVRHSSKRLTWLLWLSLAGVVLVTVAVPILLLELKSRHEAHMVKQFYDNLEQVKAGQTKYLSLFSTRDTDSLLKEIQGMPEIESVFFEHTQ